MKKFSADRLKKRRETLKKKWEKLDGRVYPTQASVSDRIPVHKVNFCRWETGKQRPSPIYMNRWLDVLSDLEGELEDYVGKTARRALVRSG